MFVGRGRDSVVGDALIDVVVMATDVLYQQLRTVPLRLCGHNKPPRIALQQISEVSESVSRVQHIIGHFGDESFQSITCAGTDNLIRTNKKLS